MEWKELCCKPWKYEEIFVPCLGVANEAPLSLTTSWHLLPMLLKSCCLDNHLCMKTLLMLEKIFSKASNYAWWQTFSSSTDLQISKSFLVPAWQSQNAFNPFWLCCQVSALWKVWSGQMSFGLQCLTLGFRSLDLLNVLVCFLVPLFW